MARHGAEMNKCNCQEWAHLGSYFCPVHGNQNKYRTRKKILKKSVDILKSAEKERLQVAGIEASKGIQPCGHPESEIWSSNGGTSYCEACEDPEYYHFKVWYKSQESQFNTSQFSSKDEVFSAFLEGVEYGKKRDKS